MMTVFAERDFCVEEFNTNQFADAQIAELARSSKIT